jgi:CopA family copper-resistance protein
MLALSRLAASMLALAVLGTPPAARADEYNLSIGSKIVAYGGHDTEAIAVNGEIPGPTLHFREGEDVVIHVTNTLPVDSSIHWHGMLVPAAMDGVPGLNGFAGIKPGQTFTYRFNVRQNGTYWYHAHSGLQEQMGLYGPIVIDSKQPDPVKADRDYVVMLSDFPPEQADRVFANLKASSDYYNYSRRTIGDFFEDVSRDGWKATVADRAMWGRMRMDPTDLSDVSGYTFLVNGKSAADNETFLFKPGERVRLRFINGGTMTYFDVKVPGLKMTVVAADGQNVVPVAVDEFRIAPAEIYDVIVEPRDDKAATIFAQAMDRTGYARATLAPRAGMSAAIPPMYPRTLLTMADMGGAMGGDMGDTSQGGDQPMAGMTLDSMDMGSTDAGNMGAGNTDMGSMDMPPAPTAASGGKKTILYYRDPMGGSDTSPVPKTDSMGMDYLPVYASDADAANAAPAAPDVRPTGWLGGFPPGEKVLSYADLKALTPDPDTRAPDKELVLHLTGNMQRFIWTINGKKDGEGEPIRLRYGERVKITFVNDTMMAHPMHLHGMYFELMNGQPAGFMPEKHIVNVPPGQSYSVLLTADEEGTWAFHCHLLYHMAAGMMTELVVARPTPNASR